jgi:hypothetical protein
MAVAIAGERIGIQPFNQPNVEAAKVLARHMIAAYQEEGRLPMQASALESDGITVYGDIKKAGSPGEALNAFLEGAQAGAYIALQAYVTPNAETEEALEALRARLRERTCRATTLGYGPRFLHSTGQLHKGGKPNGWFLQLVREHPDDRQIPGKGYTFGRLIDAQAIGDAKTLAEHELPVLRVNLGPDPQAGLAALERAVTAALKGA